MDNIKTHWTKTIFNKAKEKYKTEIKKGFLTNWHRRLAEQKEKKRKKEGKNEVEIPALFGSTSYT